MNKEQKVISLELAKELQKVAKENGFKLPESEYCWKNYMLTAYNWQKQKEAWLDDESYEQEQSMSNQYDRKLPEDAFCISAYDTSELGEMLPDNVESYHRYKKWTCGEHRINHWENAETEAEARGQMLIYLISNKLL